jgi:hypothetical protein
MKVDFGSDPDRTDAAPCSGLGSVLPLEIGEMDVDFGLGFGRESADTGFVLFPLLALEEGGRRLISVLIQAGKTVVYSSAWASL